MSDTSVNDGSGGRAFGRAKAAGGVTGSSTKRGGGGGVRMSRTTLLRIFVLLLAGASGYGAIQLAGSVQDAPAPVASAPIAPPPIETEDVLVANTELTLGKVITPDDLTWVAWPKKLVSDQAIRRSAMPKIREEMVGSLVRSGLLKGEPVRAEKLIKAMGS